MKQMTLQRLQSVKIKDVLHIFLFLAACPAAWVYKHFRKDLWLLCDKENEARDNAYWLFKYIKEERPGQDAVYAINKRSPDYKKVEALGEVVQFGSFKHWIYYLTASRNISSQKEGKPNAAVCYVLEVHGILKNTRVFLQHGITKDDMEWLYYKQTRMRLFVCAVDQEFEFVKKRFGYPDGWVVKPGFCRFDNLFSVKGEKRQILVMPTWRRWIGRKTIKSYQIENAHAFKETEYYKYWMGLLSDPILEKLLEDNGFRLVFYPHRDMQQFLDEFDIKHRNIVLAKWPEADVQQLLKESDLLITDYSSIAMDFAVMKKPILYYQFDYERFRKGHYAEGYFSYEKDGFGKVCRQQKELVDEIVKLSEHGYSMDSEYITRVDSFFGTIDRRNCERNYEVIKAIVD